MVLNFIPRTAVANVLQKQHLIVGFEKFYLKVGKVLHKKSAQVGLVKDGVVKASSSPSSSSREAERRGDPMPTSETIEAERIIDEQLHETHEHNNTVFNPCVAEFIGMMSEVAEMQEVHREIERQKAIRQINPEVLPNLSARDRIISLLLKDGASSQEIEEVFTAITPIAERVKRQQKQYAIHTFIVPNDADEAMAKRCEIEQTEIHNRNCLASTLQLFVDSAVMVNDFAEKNPKLAEFALTALDVTLSGPSKFAMNYCSKELGIQEKVNEYKDVAKSWLSGKLASISGMSQEYSELLVSGGLFGAEIGLIALGISNKNKVIDEAKNVAKKVGRSGKQARLRDLMNDDKIGRVDSGWLKQDANLIRQGKRSTLRVPPGKQLAHKRGFEANKGYGYEHADLKLISDHKIQHKHDNFGKLNKDAGKNNV